MAKKRVVAPDPSTGEKIAAHLDLKVAIELAMAAVRELADDSSIKLPRVIPIRETGGVLPLIPIFVGLSAAGALAGGAAGIAKTINEFKMAKNLYDD
ncbi:unnamed protein product [Arctia plantaginis]|uniref:Uncharacterized protein n=1 Tax=Arctia plantaginis TaxID=874455 RepID=A0A8S1AR85_ARCPL|nr:unnamed protein product [Arctia plantaginis]